MWKNVVTKNKATQSTHSDIPVSINYFAVLPKKHVSNKYRTDYPKKALNCFCGGPRILSHHFTELTLILNNNIPE